MRGISELFCKTGLISNSSLQEYLFREISLTYIMNK